MVVFLLALFFSPALVERKMQVTRRQPRMLCNACCVRSTAVQGLVCALSSPILCSRCRPVLACPACNPTPQALQNWWLSVWSEATADAEAQEVAVRTSY